MSESCFNYRSRLSTIVLNKRRIVVKDGLTSPPVRFSMCGLESLICTVIAQMLYAWWDRNHAEGKMN